MSVLVKNLKGTYDNLPPSGYSSWLDYWKQNVIGHRSTNCRECGGPGNVGAHVQKVYGPKTWYIIPLCHACNKIEDEFRVNESDLVKVGQ